MTRVGVGTVYILRVTWTNQVKEVFVSYLAAADFKDQVPHVVEVEEIAYSLTAIGSETNVSR
jgi:hypothetical protein